MNKSEPSKPSTMRWRNLWRENVRIAKRCGTTSTQSLEMLSRDFHLSVRDGDLQVINTHWYVTHTGLLRLARRKRCSGIHVEAVDSLCDSAANRFVLKATVFPSKGSSGFVGYGDADPSNVSSLVRGAEMRVAETRAVNRALRKAYGIGICSVEEIGSIPNQIEKLPLQNTNGNGNGAGPKVRDRLCQIIRQHKLDAELVKAYAVDFCGTKTLREASREQVENFVQQLADWAEKDRNALRLPTQQLHAPDAGGGRMKRQVPGLAETARDSRPEIPDGVFLVRVDGAQFRWHAHKPFYILRLSIIEPRSSSRSAHRRSSLLHPEGDVEARLVPAGFSL